MIALRMSCGSKNTNADLAKLKGIPASRCKMVQLQNLPSDEITRGSFIPNDGNLFTSCDYSALESRLGADIYNEPEMLREFIEGSGDIHSLCAKLVFHEELKDVEIKDIKHVRPDLRKKVKPIEFSQQFGGGPGAVADALGCSKEEATKFVRAYANGFKGISAFKAAGSKFVREKGYIVICKHTGHKICSRRNTPFGEHQQRYAAERDHCNDSGNTKTEKFHNLCIPPQTVIHSHQIIDDHKAKHKEHTAGSHDTKIHLHGNTS